MADKPFNVTVYRVNESAHQESEVSVSATGLNVADNGDLTIQTETGGSHHYGATTWGKVIIVRVPGR